MPDEAAAWARKAPPPATSAPTITPAPAKVARSSEPINRPAPLKWWLIVLAGLCLLSIGLVLALAATQVILSLLSPS